ncbi:Uncharacterised protein [Mycobacteroides abscessus subsp. massiliense]|nr:Uncharacterised protein [Mycobacteroides abscessus subsp. massiliense]
MPMTNASTILSSAFDKGASTACALMKNSVVSRTNTAATMSSLSPHLRYKVGRDTPARRAISPTAVRAIPWATNSSRAASNK